MAHRAMHYDKMVTVWLMTNATTIVRTVASMSSRSYTFGLFVGQRMGLIMPTRPDCRLRLTAAEIRNMLCCPKGQLKSDSTDITVPSRDYHCCKTNDVKPIQPIGHLLHVLGYSK